MTGTAGTRRRGPRRGVVLAAVLLALLVLLTTCVVVAQTGGGRHLPGAGATGSGPARASLTATPSPENSGPPATPWRAVRAPAARRHNVVAKIVLPPRPAAGVAHGDPLRASIALLAALDSADPRRWHRGDNPVAAYMTTGLARAYTPRRPRDAKGDGAEDPGDPGPDRLPNGATARYEFYCHVPRLAKRSATVLCTFHVVTTRDGTTLRDVDSVGQRLTVHRVGSGRSGAWRVAALGTGEQAGD